MFKNFYKKKNLYFWVAACALCIILYGWFAYAVRYGINRIDESFYLTIVKRLMQGDKMIVDEWHFTQLSAFVQYLPLWFFVKISGSFDGSILYMRYVFLLFSFLIYWRIIFSLRAKKINALISAFLICGFVPFAIFALNYYSVPPLIVCIICLLLVSRHGRFFYFRLVLCGILFSLCVLMVPGLTFLFILYSIAVLYKFVLKKKSKDVLSAYEFVLEPKIWLFITIGIIISATLFFLYLQLSAGLVNVFKNIANIFTNSEYTPHLVSKFMIIKTSWAVEIFGTVNFVLYIILLLASIIYKHKAVKKAKVRTTAKSYAKNIKKKHSKKNKNFYFSKLIIFAGACVLLLSVYLHAIFNRADALKNGSEDYWFIHSVAPVPILLFTLILRLICDKSDAKVFLFWWAGLFSSLCKDIFSDVSLGAGCILAVIPCISLFYSVFKELSNSFSNFSFLNKSKRKITSRVIICIFALTASLTLVWNVWIDFAGSTYLLMEKLQYHKPFSDCNILITRGSYKGIYTVKQNADIINRVLNDIDYIDKNTDGPFYVNNLLSFCYLETDKQNASYSTWFVMNDVSTQQYLYWELHPEKTPKVVYIPNNGAYLNTEKYDKALMEHLSKFAKYEHIVGEGGDIYIAE